MDDQEGERRVVEDINREEDVELIHAHRESHGQTQREEWKKAAKCDFWYSNLEPDKNMVDWRKGKVSVMGAIQCGRRGDAILPSLPLEPKRKK